MTTPKKEPSPPDTLVKTSDEAALALTEQELTKVAGGTKAETKAGPTESVSLNFTKIQTE